MPTKEELLKQLEDMMYIPNLSSQKYTETSIMDYGNICDHDSAYLCNCRRQYLLNFIKENFDAK